MAYYQKNLPNHQAYNNCSRFEEASGNDASPNSLKKQLQTALNTSGDVYDLISEDEIHAVDWEKVDMPSFAYFQNCLKQILAIMSF